MYFHFFLYRVGYVPSVVSGRLSKPTITTETVNITMMLISRNRAVVTGYDDISRKFYNVMKKQDKFWRLTACLTHSQKVDFVNDIEHFGKKAPESFSVKNANCFGESKIDFLRDHLVSNMKNGGRSEFGFIRLKQPWGITACVNSRLFWHQQAKIRSDSLRRGEPDPSPYNQRTDKNGPFTLLPSPGFYLFKNGIVLESKPYRKGATESALLPKICSRRIYTKKL